MTEQEWLTSESPQAMFRHITRRQENRQPSQRQLRLFDEAVGVARHFLGAAVEVKMGAREAAILRDIIGNPFRPIAPWEGRYTTAEALLDDAALIRQWVSPTVVAIAQEIYDESCFEDMPILADALEDAGCDNVGILAHCRGSYRCKYCRQLANHWYSDSHNKEWFARAACCVSLSCDYGCLPIGPHVRGCWVLDLILGLE